MSNYAYVALDPRGRETRGTLDVADQNEALRRLKEMGCYPTRVVEQKSRPSGKRLSQAEKRPGLANLRQLNISVPGWSGQVKPKILTVFTRQLATLVEAGMPLLRGLRILEEQESHRVLKRIIGDVSESIEGGNTLSEALCQHPRVFNRLYINMVQAGEVGGVLDLVLKRLADFMEKAQRIKSKVVAAMFYPTAVLIVAVAITGVLMVFVVPRFKEIFDGLLNGSSMPAFTLFVLKISETIKDHAVWTLGVTVMLLGLLRLSLRAKWGRRIFDQVKFHLPVLGPVVAKVAISRFTRTLGTLLSSGVPMLQALTIVKETSGNVVVGEAVSSIHESVKQGETITAPLKAARVFPAMVVGLVDVGEQTGALPEMLMKIADNYDEEVDNSVAALTSLLEPIMIILLAVIVGSIVIALFLPLLTIIEQFDGGTDSPEA